MYQKLLENIKIALRSIKSNLLRSILTILIIAFGIMALVGILTAIDSIKGSITSTFSRMGANSFSIRNRGMFVHIGREGKSPEIYRSITYQEALEFKEKFQFPAIVSVSAYGTGIATLKYKSKKTNPNIEIIGADENFILSSGDEIAQGRNFNKNEILNGCHRVIVGNNIIQDIFSKNENPIDKIISIGEGKYRIIGVLKQRGSAFGFSGDKTCIIPLANLRQSFSRPNMNYTIDIMVHNPALLDIAISEATGLFRIIRKVPIKEEDDFEILKSDSLSKMLIDNIKYVTLVATIIGIITLLGAAIGLMNIMLVAVAERTREIGTLKAIGATSNDIKRQFLLEAIIIGQLGGILGIILGILVGNLLTLFIGGRFIVPWLWILSGILLCLIVSLSSGIFPAIKSAKLDPIEALRYE